jgi:hypothetical protein
MDRFSDDPDLAAEDSSPDENSFSAVPSGDETPESTSPDAVVAGDPDSAAGDSLGHGAGDSATDHPQPSPSAQRSPGNLPSSDDRPPANPIPALNFSNWGALDLTGVPVDQILATLLTCDPDTAPVKDNLSASWVCEYLIRTLAARQNHHLARAAARHEAEHPQAKSTGAEVVAGEISPRFTLTKGQARYRVNHAHDLTTDLPTILNLVARADLDLHRATKVDTLMREHLQPGTPQWNAVAAHITRIAPGKTVHELTAAVRHAIDSIDPTAAQNRHARAKKARNVRVFPLPDGMAAVNATVSAEDAILCDEVLDALADACRDYTATNGHPDPRTHDQRRSDVHSAVWRAIAHGTPLPIIPFPRVPEAGDGQMDSGRSGNTGRPDSTGSRDDHWDEDEDGNNERATRPHGDQQHDGRRDDRCPIGHRDAGHGDAGHGDAGHRDAGHREAGCLDAGEGGRESQGVAEPARLTEQLSRESEQRDSDLDHVLFGGTLLPPDAQAPVGGGATVRDLSRYCPGVLAWWMPPTLPTRHGRRPHLVITMAAATLNGQDELPGDLLGYGPITAPHARAIATTAGRTSIIRIPTGPHPSQAPPPSTQRPWATLPAVPGSPTSEAPSAPDLLAESSRAGSSSAGSSVPGSPVPGSPVLGSPEPGSSVSGVPVAGSPVPESPEPGSPAVEAPANVASARPAAIGQARTSGPRTSSPRASEPDVPAPTASWSFGGPHEHGPGDLKPCPHPGRPYKPSQKLTDKMIRLHQRCTYAGCTARAERCDLDHIRPYAEGGTTCACNLHPLCRTHHRLKTYAGWKARYTRADEPQPAGTVEWTSAHGLTHVSPPPVQPGSNGWQAPPSDPGDLLVLAEPEHDDVDPPDTTTPHDRRAERLALWYHGLERIARQEFARHGEPSGSRRSGPRTEAGGRGWQGPAGWDESADSDGDPYEGGPRDDDPREGDSYEGDPRGGDSCDDDSRDDDSRESGPRVGDPRDGGAHEGADVPVAASPLPPTTDPEHLGLRACLRFLTERSPFFTRPGLCDPKTRHRPPPIDRGEPPF